MKNSIQALTHFVIIALVGLGSAQATIQPGLWFDPEYAGNGIEFRQTGDELSAIIYTYDQNGSPIWYIAHGPIDEQGMAQMPVHRYAWPENASLPVADEVVGEWTFRVNHQQAIDVSFDLPHASGQWQMQPLTMSHRLREIDRSGLWFDDQQPGWGLSLQEQGDWQAMALYFYDSDGEPTWLLGTNHGEFDDTFEMQSFTGCPNCTTNDPGDDAGTATLDWHEATTTLQLSLPQAGEPWHDLERPLVALTPRADSQPHPAMLQLVDNFDQLESHLKSGFWNRSGSAPSGNDFSPPQETAPSPGAFSETNLQVDDVDESDLVKVQGDQLYSVHYRSDSDNSRLIELRNYQLDSMPQALVPGPSYTLHGSHESGNWFEAKLYRWDDELLVLRWIEPSLYAVDICPSPWIDAEQWQQGATLVDRFSIDDDGNLQAVETLRFDGYLISDRRVGNQVYLALRHAPYLPEFIRRADSEDEIAFNQQLLQQTPLDALLPQWQRNDEAPMPLLDIERTWLPPGGDRTATADMLVITELQIDEGEPAEVSSLTMAGTSDGLFVSNDAIYLMTRQYDQIVFPEGSTFAQHYTQTTEVHRIDTTAEGLVYRGSGRVEGTPDTHPDALAWRFGQIDDHLGVVTAMNGPQAEPFGPNRLTMLSPSELRPGLLAERAHLPNAERPEPIGKPGETVRGMRFSGQRAYVTTFELIDPFYIVNLDNPDDPYIAGELEIPGTTEYIHPIDDNLVLALGYDTILSSVDWSPTPVPFFAGIQLMLLDTSDPAAPVMLDRSVLGGRGSSTPAFNHHHAVAWLPGNEDRPGRLAIPISIHEPDPTRPPPHYLPWSYDGVAVFDIDPVAQPGQIINQQYLSHREEPGYWSGKRRVVLGEESVILVHNDGLWHAPLALPGTMQGPL